MDPADSHSSEDAYFFHEDFDWEVHGHEVLSGPVFTQEELDLMVEIPSNKLDNVLNDYEQNDSNQAPNNEEQNAFDLFLKDYDQAFPSVPHTYTQEGNEPESTSRDGAQCMNDNDQVPSSVSYEKTECAGEFDSIFQDPSLAAELVSLEHELSLLAAEQPDWTNPTALSSLENGSLPQNDSTEASPFGHTTVNEPTGATLLSSSPVHQPGIMTPEPVHTKSSPLHSAGKIFAQPVPKQSTPVRNSIVNKTPEPTTWHSTPVHSTGTILSDSVRSYSSPIGCTPMKSSIGTNSPTPRSANIDETIFNAMKELGKVAERPKLTPKPPTPRTAAAWAELAYPFSRSPRPPSASRRAMDAVTISPEGIFIDTPTPMRKRSFSAAALTTPSKSRKRKVPATDESSPLAASSPGAASSSPPRSSSSPSPSPSSRNTPYHYPKSWDTASGEDILLFDMKNNDHSWKEITETFRRVTSGKYARTTLQNRYNKIKARLGDMPKSLRAAEVLEDVDGDLADRLGDMPKSLKAAEALEDTAGELADLLL